MLLYDTIIYISPAQKKGREPAWSSELVTRRGEREPRTLAEPDRVGPARAGARVRVRERRADVRLLLLLLLRGRLR